MTFTPIRVWWLSLATFGVARALIDWQGRPTAMRLALALGEACGFRVERLSGRVLWSSQGPFFAAPDWVNWAFAPTVELMISAPALLIAVVAYALLFRRVPRDGFTRCGRCNHILHGLIEPRCPECGTRI